MYTIICASCMTACQPGETCPHCGQALTNANPSGSLPEGLLLNDTYRVGAMQSLDSEGILYDAVDITSHRAYQIKEYVPITLCSGRDEDLGLQVRVGSEVPYKNNAADFTDLYGKLRHFNNDICLLGVREVFYANNTVYAVTEKAEGLSLEAYLQKRGGRLGWNEALDLLDPLWLSVERLHRAGIIHRGICCENITVTGPGVVRLGGFATQAMRTQGTELKSQLYTGYAAPEQYQSSAFDGPFTDIYALSAVLYRVITGLNVPSARERLNEDTLEDPTEYANAPLPDGSVQKLPLYLADAILHGLQLEGAERFADMPAFRAALAGQKPQAAAPRAPGGAVHTEPEKKRAGLGTDAKIAIGTCVGLLLVFLVVLLIWSGGRDGRDDGSSLEEDTTSSMTSSFDSLSGESGDESESETADTSSESQPAGAPQLVGMLYADARLEYGSYRFQVTYAYSSDYEEGRIMQQSPEEGQPVTDNTISITISQGVEPLPLPDLVGSTQASAEALLQGMNVSYTIVTVINDGSWAEGVVTETTPGEGAMVQPGITDVIVRVAGALPVSSSEPESTPPVEEPTPPPAESESPAESEGTGE